MRKDKAFQDHHHILSNIPAFRTKLGDNYVPQGFSKRLDLKVNATTVTFNEDQFNSIISKKGWSGGIAVINRLLFTMRWVEVTWSLARFGDAAALANGIKVNYTFNKIVNDLFTNNVIQDLGDFFQVGGNDTAIVPDSDQAVKGKQLICEVDFQKAFEHSIVLDLSHGDTFDFDVQDNLTASPTYDNISEISVRVQGHGFMKR